MLSKSDGATEEEALPYISPVSPLYLPYISPISPYIGATEEEALADHCPNPTPQP